MWEQNKKQTEKYGSIQEQNKQQIWKKRGDDY